jgi:hypothetical protein
MVQNVTFCVRVAVFLNTLSDHSGMDPMFSEPFPSPGWARPGEADPDLPGWRLAIRHALQGCVAFGHTALQFASQFKVSI